MYPQDFPVERLTPVIDLPMILAGLTLLVLAVAAGYAFARLGERDRKPAPRVVAASIHSAIQRKLNAALAAHGGATSNAAQALVDEVDIRLGDVARLTGDLGKSSSALRDALAGKRKLPPAPPAPTSAPTSPHAFIVPIPGQGSGSAASAASGGTAGAVAEVSAPEGGLVGAILNLAPPPRPPAPPPAPLSAAEQTAAVRAAVEAFAVHWGTVPSDPAAGARIDELEAAAIQLTTEVPIPRFPPGSAHRASHT